MGKLLTKGGIFILSAILFLTGCGGSNSSTPSSGGPSSVNLLPSSRSDFVRTDDTPSSIVYDPTHNLIFACESKLSIVDVISTMTKKIVRRIPLPGAYGLTIAPDDSLVYAGGYMQKLVAISTQSLTVVHRYTLPVVGGQYYSAPWPVATSAGTILIKGNIASDFGFFDPATGTLNANTQQNGCFLGHIFARSADGSKILDATNTAPGYFALIDVPSASCVAQRQVQGFASEVAARPDGTQFAILTAEGPDAGIYFLDDSLNILGTAPVGGLVSGMVYSPDGRFLYIVSDLVASTDPYATRPEIWKVDTTTFQLVATAPAYRGIYAGSNNELEEIPMAADATGVLFGAANYGVAFDDATLNQNFSSSEVYPVSLGASPAEGTLQGDTPVSISIGNLSGPPTVWFGSNPGTKVSQNTTGVQVTTPPASSPGPVNIRIFDPDGESAIMPQAFSYGPSPITYGTLAAGPGGGATADLFGNGFSTDVQGAAVSVRIGGQDAPITKTEWSYNDVPYALYLQHLRFTTPAGTPGAQDITISTPVGSTTIPKGFHILKSVDDYPTTDKLLDILYDQTRQQIYLSAGDHIDVFSLTDSRYFPPIVPPTLGGQLGLRGLALTPDSSRLLVANYLDDSVAVISPDSPSAATAVQIVPPGTFLNPVPAQVATTSLNTAFVVTGGGVGSLYILDLGTLQASIDSDSALSHLESTDSWISSSTDGSRAIIANSGVTPAPAFTWTAATNKWTEHSLGASLIDGTVSGDGSAFSAVGQNGPGFPPAISFLDKQANVLGTVGLPDFLQAMLPQPSPGATTYLTGARLNNSGSLVYVPFAHGIDIYDVHHGDLRERISLTEQMSNGGGSVGDLTSRIVHSMAIDETGKRLFLITDKGLTIVQLDALPLSIGSVTPASGAAGAQVTVRGSGFVQGAMVSANGTSAAVNYVDGSTLDLTLPSLPAGAVQFKITNPDGQSYTLDDAFTVQ